MSLEEWSASRFVVPHESSRQEIAELLEIVRTDLADARVDGLSSKRRLACCSSALLNAARAALQASGYRAPRGSGSHHHYAVQSLRFTVGLDATAVQQIETLRKKRGEGDYVRIGGISESMVAEALDFAEDCCGRIADWIRAEYSNLL